MDFLKKLKIQQINPAASAGLEWINGNHDKMLASINPSNENVIAKTAYINESEYEYLIQKAHNTFLTWRNVPAPVRGEVVRQIANELREYKDALGSLVSLEMGKSKEEGDGEVQEMIDIADFAVSLSRMLYGKTMHSERPLHRIQEQWHPLGVVGVITAFNFPVAVWAWNAFIAAVCGNAIVWKPSHKVPLCAIAVQHICNQVMQRLGYDGVFSYFIADHDIRDKLTHDKRIALISFTGSTAAGKHVAQTVASRLGKTILELGGNNAIIVDQSADLKLAIPAIIFGAVGTAGQRCTTTRRVIIHESIYGRVIEALCQGYQKLKIGDPLDKNNFVTPLIDAKAVQLFQDTIDEIKMHHGEILCGGNRLDRPGFYVEPTIAAVENDWPMVQRESFVPILYVMKFKNVDEAIHMQNDVAQGLSSAIFTNDFRHAELFISAAGSDCGLANVNIGTSGAEIGGAFGGEKETGGGRESGSDAWKAYMRRQTTTVNWGQELPLAQGIKFNQD